MSDLTPAFVRIRTQKAQSEDWAFYLHSVGWLMGLEPTTTGITILCSTEDKSLILLSYSMKSLEF